MRHVCAWCEKILATGGSSPEKTTHGVCHACARRLGKDPLSDGSKTRASKQSRKVRIANQQVGVRTER